MRYGNIGVCRSLGLKEEMKSQSCARIAPLFSGVYNSSMVFNSHCSVNSYYFKPHTGLDGRGFMTSKPRQSNPGLISEETRPGLFASDTINKRGAVSILI